MHRRAGVQTVRTFHPPGEDVAGAGALDAQNRIGIESQRLVDTSGQQHQQMSHSRSEIDPISACGIGFHGPRGSVELVHQMRPRRRQAHVTARWRLGGRLGDGVRQPRHRWLHCAHVVTASACIAAP